MHLELVISGETIACKVLLSVLLSVAWAIYFSFSSEIQVKSQTLEKEAKECRLRTEEWYVETWIPRGFWSKTQKTWVLVVAAPLSCLIFKRRKRESSPGSFSILGSPGP